MDNSKFWIHWKDCYNASSSSSVPVASSKILFKELPFLQKVSIRKAKYVISYHKTEDDPEYYIANEPQIFPISQDMLIEFVRNHTPTLTYFRSDLTDDNKVKLNKEHPNLMLL